MIRIAVNTISTKSYSGGALQIAYNFLMETLKHQDGIEWLYITSEDVDEQVGKSFEEIRGEKYFVFPTQPDFRGSYKRVKKELARWEEEYRPDIIYTISSPCYFTFKTPEVMRFANAWVTNPNKESWQSMSLKKRIRTHLYCYNQKRLLRKAQYIITQSETVRQGLLKITGLPENHIKVVPNVLPGIFAKTPVTPKSDEFWIDVNCAAAPVPHKNLVIIPKVLKELRDNFQITNIRFHLTIPPKDPLYINIKKKSQTIGMSANIVNHGRCTQQQLIEVYNQCRICFLSTLLETFSASSLEAMHFRQLIVATDYEFNREVIGDAGLYYRPLDAKDAASKFCDLINNDELSSDLIKKMDERLKNYNNYERHFGETISFLQEVVLEEKK